MGLHAGSTIAVSHCFLGNLTKKNTEGYPYPANLCRSKIASSAIDGNIDKEIFSPKWGKRELDEM